MSACSSFAQDAPPAQDAATEFALKFLIEYQRQQQKKILKQLKESEQNGFDLMKSAPDELEKKAAELAQKIDQNIVNEVLPLVLTNLLNQLARQLPGQDWCKLYEQWRGGESARFKGDPDEHWQVLDTVHKAQCKRQPKGPHGLKECPPGEKTIQQCAATENLSIELVGDGKNTRYVGVIVKVIENGQVIKQGATIVNTVCADHMTDLPPPALDAGAKKGLTFKVIKADPEVTSIIKTARKLSDAKQFKSKLAPTEVAQYAIWGRMDKLSPTKLSQVFGEKLESKITPRDDAEKLAFKEFLNDVAEDIEAVDKSSRTMIAEQPPKKDGSEPPDSSKPDDSSQPQPDGSKPEDKIADGAKPDDSSQPPDSSKPDDSPQPPDASNPKDPATAQDCIDICIPEFTTFSPSDPADQNMTTTEPTHIHLVPEDTALISFGPPASPPDPDGAESPKGELIDTFKGPCAYFLEETVIVTDKAEGLQKKALDKALEKLVDTPGAARAEIAVLKLAIDQLGIGEDAERVIAVFVCRDATGKALHRIRREIDRTELPLFSPRIFRGLVGTIGGIRQLRRERLTAINRKKPPGSCCEGPPKVGDL